MRPKVVGLIDFGDMLYGSIAAELATTCYAAQDRLIRNEIQFVLRQAVLMKSFR